MSCGNNCSGCGCENKNENENTVDENEVFEQISSLRKLEEQTLYLKAELENQQKRLTKNTDSKIRSAISDTLSEFVEIEYSLEQLSLHLDQTGIDNILENYRRILKSLNVSIIDTISRDRPLEYQIISQKVVDDIEQAGGEFILLMPGYKYSHPGFEDKIIKPAIVIRNILAST